MLNDGVINIVHLHVLYSGYKTGIDRYLEMYAQGVNGMNEYRKIHVHSVFFTDDKKILFPRINMSENGEIIAIVPFPQNDVLLFKSSFWKNGYEKVVINLLQPYLRNKLNLIYQCHNLFLTDLAKELKAKLEGKIIIHLHCIPWKFKSLNNILMFNKLYNLYQNKEYEAFGIEENGKINYNDADKIICLSQAAKDYLLNVQKIEGHKIEIIPNGLQVRTGVMKRKLRRKNTILYVGKVSKDKGIFELLESLLEVQRLGFCFKLVIAGTCSPIVWKKIQLKYSSIDIEYLGQVTFDVLQELYSTCVMGVIPSLHEQCSYVALEMACFGMPMIVAEVDALAEMFEHGKTALLVPYIFDLDFGLSANRDVFVGNVIKLLKNQKLRTRLSENVRLLYEQRFGLDAMMKQMFTVYQQLI